MAGVYGKRKESAKEFIRIMKPLSTDITTHKIGKCQIIVSKDAGLWHLSISRKDRLPTYDEMKTARYQFLPDVPYMVQIFPPKEDFVNVHQFCLHLWEPKDFVYSELNIEEYLNND